MQWTAVLLDAGQTLIGPRESFGTVYAEVLGPLGLTRPAGEFDEALRRAWMEMSGLVPEGRDRYSWFPDGERGYWLRFARSALRRLVGDGPSDGLAERAIDPLLDAFRRPEAWQVYADVGPALDALDEAGVRLAVVSNWDSRLRELLQDLGLAHRFERIVVSSEVGFEKPHPGIFLRALEALDVSGDEVIHVGDLPDVDLTGARAAGVRGVLLDREGVHDPALGALRDLRHLARIVGDPGPGT